MQRGDAHSRVRKGVEVGGVVMEGSSDRLKLVGGYAGSQVGKGGLEAGPTGAVEERTLRRAVE